MGQCLICSGRSVMTTELAQKLEGVRDFRKILETVVKELGETYSADVSQIVLSNPLDSNLTSICEYKLDPDVEAEQMPVRMSFALPLEGRGLGAITLARRTEFHENEVNWIRITLAELTDVIRHSQINDIVQRDTFRNTFLFEIQNVMQYSLGIGDALFMVVNILGKVLNVSRCLFICVDDEKAGWKAYEFWQRERTKSCQEYGWPTTDSAIVARSLLASSPLMVQEANQNSYLTPLQEELQLLGVRSLLGVPLKSAEATHGCIIMQHCDSRHEWTRSELDMVQNVADTVAEALAKFPEEKRAREPIMRLHQRDVVDGEGGSDGNESILAVRRALRGAMQQAIPSANKTSQPVPKPKPVVAQTPAATPPPPTVPVEQQFPPAAATTPEMPTHAPWQEPTTPQVVPPTAATPPVTPPPSNGSDINELANSLMAQARASGDPNVADEVSNTLQSLLQGMNIAPPTPTTTAPSATPTDKGFDLSSLDSIPTPGPNLDATTQISGAGGNPASPGSAADSWSSLDAIPTPAAGPARGGLGGSMFGKKTSNAAAQSPLLASLHKDKSKFQQSVQYLDGGTLEIDEVKAQEKLKQVMATAEPTSDYIFATPGLDPRMLGRIDGWITQIEQKDKFEQPHAMQVAEFSVAIANVLGLPDEEILNIRLAGILHDVGKLGLPASVLQKPEEELSDNELLLIMKHPIDGANLVEGFPELLHVAPLILAHHEEYDGNGYPAGLAAEDIPLGARIIHVASAYHNMVSPTKRRAGVPSADAQQAMRSLSGKAYDPAVVEAFLTCLQQGLATALR